nr:hypothetical protein [Pandoravirus massiliensis]
MRISGGRQESVAGACDAISVPVYLVSRTDIETTGLFCFRVSFFLSKKTLLFVLSRAGARVVAWGLTTACAVRLRRASQTRQGQPRDAKTAERKTLARLWQRKKSERLVCL